MTIPLQRHTFDEFDHHLTQTEAQLEEISGDLYALESMISLAHDVEDLKLYQTHCSRLEATIYTLHEKIGVWQQGVKNRGTRFSKSEYNPQTLQLDNALMRIDGCIINVCYYEEKIMRLQKMVLDQKSTFVLTQQMVREQELVG